MVQDTTENRDFDLIIKMIYLDHQGIEKGAEYKQNNDKDKSGNNRYTPIELGDAAISLTQGLSGKYEIIIRKCKK